MKQPSASTGREPQQERSTATRAKVLDAAVEVLLELGYAGTTTALVADRAGVSRGAMQYHFRTKRELLTAALEHLMQKRGTELRRTVGKLPSLDGTDRASAIVDVLWKSASDPLAVAWMELVLAARNDRELKKLVDGLGRRFGAAIEQQCVELFGEDAGVDDPTVFVDMTLALMSGLVLARMAGVGGRSRRREQQCIEAWKAAAPELLATDLVP